MRHTAHRCAFFKSAISAGKDKIKLLGCDLRILEKHLVKVTETAHKYAILMVLLDLKILFHKRRESHGKILRIFEVISNLHGSFSFRKAPVPIFTISKHNVFL
jgi:hypothetical protein